MNGSTAPRQKTRRIRKDTVRALAIPAAYSPNITSPCRFANPHTVLSGMNAAMISV